MQSARLGLYTVYFENSEEYHRIKREVWGANQYYVEIEKDSPIIIDGGGYIGLTTLYYKKMFPDAKIVAYEPLKANAELFRKNLYENQIEGVELIVKAIAESEGQKTLYFDATDEKWYSTAGFSEGAWTGDQQSSSIVVETQSLSSILDQYHPDLVKLDIEGAEEKALVAARHYLLNCPHYIIEFHPVEGRGMERIIKNFEDNGYKVKVSKDGSFVPWEKVRGLCMIEAIRE